MLRLVEFGDGFEVISASAGQVLLGLNILQNDFDTELLSLLGQTQPFLGGGQRHP